MNELLAYVIGIFSIVIKKNNSIELMNKSTLSFYFQFIKDFFSQYFRRKKYAITLQNILVFLLLLMPFICALILFYSY
jgi:hypothetical protein